MRRLLSAALIASTMAFAACVHGPLLTTQATTPPVAGSAARPPKFGDSIVYGGLRYVSHDSTMTGSGTISSPLSATASLSGGVTGDIVDWASPTTVGNYGGSSPSACSAGTAMTDLALSAAGVLTLTCTQQLTGAGAGTTGDLMAWTSASAAGNYAGSSPSACTSGSVMTDAALSAAGVMSVTCGVTPLTATNVSGTANDLAKFTATNTVGNSNFVDDGTTATLGTSLATVSEATGRLLLNTSGAATAAQLVIESNSADAVTLLNLGSSGQELGFGDSYNSGHVAWNANPGIILSYSGTMRFYGDAGKTIGASYTPTERMELNYTNGTLTLLTGGITATAAASSFAGVTATGLTVNGNATLGNTDAALATVRGHLAGYNATAPTISSCGTSTLTTHSSDLDGKIVWDASSTACTLTFHTAFTNTPSCTLTYEDTNAKGYDAQWIHSAAASNIIIYQSSASGSTVNYHCVGMQQ